jgi:addiction module HigA family antidote
MANLFSLERTATSSVIGGDLRLSLARHAYEISFSQHPLMDKQVKLMKTKKTSSDLIPISHPGTILLEQFLEPGGISQYRLAQAADIPASRLTDIIKGRRGITADTAIRLSKAIGMNPKFWLGLQQDYEVRMAERANAHDYAGIPLLAGSVI